ncbi:hypothetical protein A3C59_03875, partial [Candidatus Daviesbacteria bacterium RIFCSPHIGHO2_02_FULL_36_13]
MDIMGELLASQSKKIITLNRGQQAEGTIVSITEKEITLDLGSKSEGVLQRREVETQELKLGDQLKVFISQTENESGQVVVSTTPQMRSSTSDRGGRGGRGIYWNKFIQAQSQKIKLKGTVLEVNKGGLIVEVDGARGFLPNSQVGFELLSKASKGLQDLVGQTLSITVIEIDQNDNRLIFSQRGQVSDEVKGKLKEFKTGDKAKGKIVAVLPFGLVVDINGSEGLVFISDVSWEKVEDLSTLYKVEDEVEVVVTGLDEELGRLSLSIKQLAEDPFTKLSEKFPADEVVKGEITGISEDGVSVKLDGAEGFLPSSKMDSDSKYEAGKSMSFLVDGVDTRKRRVTLAPFVTSTAGLI